MAAIWPFCYCGRKRIFEDDRYDLYGPFWIMATLIVEIAIVGFIDYQLDLIELTDELKEGKTIIDYKTLYSM